MTRKYSKKEVIKLFREIHGYRYKYPGDYNGMNNKMEIYCTKCKKSFYQKPNDHVNGHGCYMCSVKKVHKALKYTKKEFETEAKKAHPYPFHYGYKKVKYLNSQKPIEIYCPRCKKYFWQKPIDHLRKYGCPYCKKSTGEKIIYTILKKNKINFIEQKKFKDCRNKLPLPFDFYLPDYNLCIEYQGEQHYKPQMYINIYKSKEKGMKRFEAQKKNDQIKRNYCKTHNIKLLEITYKNNIKEKLEKHIKLV